MKIPALLCALAALSPLPASAAESDWFASLYTGEGTELRADERVFTLYALLNAMGYDDAPVSRKEPIPKRDFHPVRREIRSRLAAASPDVQKQADAFFDAHPVAVDRYLAYTLGSAPPPAFEAGSKAKELAELKGFEALLKTVYQQWNVGDLMGQVQNEYRKALKGYLTALDGPVQKAKKALKVPESGSTLLVMNLLESQNQVRGVLGEQEVVLVVGPSDKPNMELLIREYARLFVQPPLAKKSASWGGGAVLLREAQLHGAKEASVPEYATALFTRALALRAVDAPDAAYDAATQQGYYGLKDIARMFDDARPVEAWALDALAKAETRMPAKK